MGVLSRQKLPEFNADAVPGDDQINEVMSKKMEQKLSRLKKAKLRYTGFTKKFKTLLMATSDENGVPNTSYSPYVKIGNSYYVYVSELAEHTNNLTTTHRASIFFVQDESKTKNLFARRRLTYNCDAEEVNRNGSTFDSTMDAFAESFSEKFITMIRGLEDFHLFKITPYSGIFVNGFAQAYKITGENMAVLVHRDDVGHRASDKKINEQMDAITD